MARTTQEWIGKNDDSRAPAKVRVRVFHAQDGKCAMCGRKMAVCGEPFEIDHTQALILGGENREGNLRALCRPCHTGKTKQDVTQKATEARKRAKHLDARKTRNPIPGSKGSRWKRRIDGTVIERESDG